MQPLKVLLLHVPFSHHLLITRIFVAPTTLFNPNKGHFGSGSVGHRGYLFRALRRELKLIKIDPISEEPVRGPDGFCVVVSVYMSISFISVNANFSLKSDYGEQGELLVRIDNADALGFDGYYKNEGATKKKILTNVLQKGDAYFRSGDLLQMDRDGFYFFGDRVGDTFRWKVMYHWKQDNQKPVD